MLLKVTFSMLTSVIAINAFASTAHWQHRGEENTRKALAHECASVIHEQTGQSKFELVRLVDRSGVGNYEFWLNSHDKNLGAYCTTKSGLVVSTYVKEETWRGTQMFRPRHQDTASVK